MHFAAHPVWIGLFSCGTTALLPHSFRLLSYVQAMALNGAQVVVSDTEDMMQLLSMNIKANMAALHASSGKLSGSISLQ